MNKSLRLVVQIIKFLLEKSEMISHSRMLDRMNLTEEWLFIAELQVLLIYQALQKGQESHASQNNSMFSSGQNQAQIWIMLSNISPYNLSAINVLQE